MGSLGAGSLGWWPVTASRARPRTSRGRAAARQPDPAPAAHHRSDRRITGEAGRQGPRQWAAHDRLAPGTPPWPGGVGGHHPPAPARGRADHPRTAEAAQVVLQPVRRRTTNGRWQADFTHWWLADGTHVEILNWIDDHARYALSVTAHRRVTGPSCSMPSAMPVPLTASRPPHSPTTAWSSPPGWPAAKAAATDWRTSCAAWAWSRSTPPPITPRQGL